MLQSRTLTLVATILGLTGLAATGCASPDGDDASNEASAIGGAQKNICSSDLASGDRSGATLDIALAQQGPDTVVRLQAKRRVPIGNGRSVDVLEVRTLSATNKPLADTRKLLKSASAGVWSSVSDGLTTSSYSSVDRGLSCRNVDTPFETLLGGTLAWSGASTCHNDMTLADSPIGRRSLVVSEVPEGAVASIAESSPLPDIGDVYLARERFVFLEGATAKELLDALATTGSDAAVSALVGAPTTAADMTAVRATMICRDER